VKKTPAFIILCAIGGLAIFSSTISKNPVLPILAQGIGATTAVIGLIAAASTVTGILTSLPAGLLSDQHGRKPVLIASGIVFFTAPLFYFLVQTAWQLALVRVYHGLATAIFGPVSLAYVTDLAPTRRGERLGYFSSTTLAGRALAPIVGGAILTWGAWQGVYVVCAIAGFFALAGMFFLPNPRQREGENSRPKPAEVKIPLRQVLSNLTIVTTSIAEAAQLLAFGALETFLPLYALSVGINPAALGLLFGAQIAVRMLSRPIMGLLSDQKGRKMPILLGLVITAFSVALFPQTTSLWVLLLLSAVFGLGVSIASAATSAFVADTAPAEGRGTAMGFMSTIMDIGQAIGPVLLGALLVSISYQAGFAIIGAIVLAATMIFGFTAVEKRRQI